VPCLVSRGQARITLGKHAPAPVGLTMAANRLAISPINSGRSVTPHLAPDSRDSAQCEVTSPADAVVC
jgi:hypothetical protein